jgi:hypothetical protein
MRKAGIDKDVARTIVGHKTDNMARRYQTGRENEMKPVQNPYILAKINLSEFVSASESSTGG